MGGRAHTLGVCARAPITRALPLLLKLREEPDDTEALLWAIAIMCAFAGGIIAACAIGAPGAPAHMLGGGIAMAIGIPVGFATEGMAPGGINGGWPRIH